MHPSAASNPHGDKKKVAHAFLQVPVRINENAAPSTPYLCFYAATFGPGTVPPILLEGVSNAPTDWEMSQIDLLSKKIPGAADEVRKLVSEDLAALNAMMLEAKIPYIQPPTLGGGGAGRRPPTDDDNDEEP